MRKTHQRKRFILINYYAKKTHKYTTQEGDTVEDSHVNNVLSKPYLEDITVTPPQSPYESNLPHLTLNFTGNMHALRQMQAQLTALMKAHKLEMKSDVVATPRVTPPNSGYFSMAFYHLDKQHRAEDILGLIHRATHCDIGASARATFDDYDRTNHRTKQITTTFFPATEIRVMQADEKTRQVVMNYLCETLGKEYHEQYTLGSIGQIGLPSEYCCEGKYIRLPDNPEGKITLTYSEQTTQSGGKAKMIAAAATEHICGQLGIPESINPSKSLGTRSIRK